MHVRRAKGGQEATHPLLGNELRALRETQSLFVHPTSLLVVQRQVIGAGIPAWGGDTASIVNSPVCCTQKYLIGAEVERLMVMILLADVILIIRGALVILLPPYCGRAERDVAPAASRHPGSSKRR